MTMIVAFFSPGMETAGRTTTFPTRKKSFFMMAQPSRDAEE
jgi:hypothetical protein